MGSDVLSFSFWLGFIYFFIAVSLSFYFPGSFLLSRTTLSVFQKIVLGTIIGIAMWGIQGFLFGYLGIRYFSYLYVAAFFLFWIIPRIKPKKKVHLLLHFKTLDWYIFLIICIGVALQLSGVWFMSTKTANGLLMCCGNIPDNNLQLAITNEITHRFPPYEPGMHGVFIQNYHYWSHLIVGELVRVFKLPLIATEYQYMSFLISLGLGLSAVAMAQLLSLKKVFIRWFLFFLYFSGELTYLTIFIVTRKIDFSIGSVENSAQFLMNYPRALAIVVLMGALSVFILWTKSKKNYLLYTFCIICGTLIGYKVYVGMFALSGLAALSIYFLIKRHFANLIPIILAFIISVAIYLPVNSGAGGLFFAGLWRVKDFAQIQQYNLGSSIMALEIYWQNNNILRIVEYSAFLIVLFVFSSFGLKILGVFQTKKSLSRVPFELHIFLIAAIAVSFVLGMFFLQKTGGANTFNFLTTVVIISSFYTALSISYFFENLKSDTVKLFFVGLIIILSIPRLIYMGNANINDLSRGQTITQDEISALTFLKNNTPQNSLVLVDPQARLSDYDAPYVSYLTNRPTYYSGIERELREHVIDYSARERRVNTIFKSKNEQVVKKTLQESGVSYLFLKKTGTLMAPQKNLVSTVFQNEYFKVFKVK